MQSLSPYYHQAARLDLRRYPAARNAYEILCEVADASGVVTLEGGVRGWAEALGCAAGYPSMLFALLEALGFVEGVEYYPGEGGRVAEVHLRPADDRSLIAPPPPAAALAAPRQDAVGDLPDRSLIESPHTPLYGTDHESMQQQQHDRAHARAAEPPGLTAILASEVPGADPALLRCWEADPYVNDCAAAVRALVGRPGATLAEWHHDLAAASGRPGVGWPHGLTLAAWARGERVLPRRSPPAPATAVAPPDRPRRPGGRTDPGAFDATAARVFLGQAPPSDPAPPATPPPDPALRAHWQVALLTLRDQLPPGEFDTWIRRAELAALEGDRAIIRAGSAQLAQGLSQRHGQVLRRVLGDLVGRPLQLQVVAP